jgi:LacI family transcriptional regulator
VPSCRRGRRPRRGASRRPHGVVCLGDLIACGAQRACREAGLRVPQDVLLVGFDDNPLNDWLAPWLTTVRVPVAQIGEAVVATLEGIARDGRSVGVVLPFAIVER